jgi:hypothetical protein
MREPARGIPQKQADGRTPEPGRAADAERPESIREWPEQPSPGEAREKLDEMRVAPTGESLVKYAGGGQLDTVNLLLAAGVDIDSRAKVDPKARGMTALSFALNKNESEMVHFLIDRSADVNLADGNGITPLAAAAGKGDVEIFEALSAAGADPNTPDRKGRTPLLAAAENGDVRIVGALLAKGLDPNHADARGETPLFAAIRKSNTDAVKVLMADGADAHFANKDGRTPLCTRPTRRFSRPYWPRGPIRTRSMREAARSWILSSWSAALRGFAKSSSPTAPLGPSANPCSNCGWPSSS